MTATLPPRSQPRVPAGHTGGGRFASTACPTTYRRLAEAITAPLPEPDDDGWTPPLTWTADPANPMRTVIAPDRCPHGHYARYARGADDKGRPNCPPCHR